MKHSPINNVLITAATHGNEMSGIQAVKQWQQQPSLLAEIAPSVTLHYELVNQQAVLEGKRYVEEDLNRQFTFAALDKHKNSGIHEHILAQQFNQKYGPKGASSTELVIDIHNTTSNMGPTLIVLVNDHFHQQLARFVKMNMPSAMILVEDFQAYDAFGYLCTLGHKGVMIEVGPQPQGILKAKAYQETIEMAELIMRFVEHFNNDSVQQLPPVEAFRLGKEVAYPCHVINGALVKSAMIHENLDGNDFQLLAHGAPCFRYFDGTIGTWDEADTYPHFIGEAAYDNLHIAFASSEKCLF